MKEIIEKWNSKSDLKSEMFLAKTETPLGDIWIGTTNEGICFVDFIDDHEFEDKSSWIPKSFKMKFTLKEAHPFIEQLKKELEAYFNQKQTYFKTPLVLSGTDFQKQVYKQLSEVPYGTTITYQQQALNMGNQKAIRAVATANGSNKHLIVIPCHRIIGKDGNLTGYAGGIWRKKALLELENAFMQTELKF